MNRDASQPQAATTPAASVEVFWGAFVAVVPSDRDARRFAMLLKECGRRHGLECTNFGTVKASNRKQARSMQCEPMAAPGNTRKCGSVAAIAIDGHHKSDGIGSKGGVM